MQKFRRQGGYTAWLKCFRQPYLFDGAVPNESFLFTAWTRLPFAMIHADNFDNSLIPSLRQCHVLVFKAVVSR